MMELRRVYAFLVYGTVSCSPQYPSRPLFVLLPGASTEPTGSWGSTPRSREKVVSSQKFLPLNLCVKQKMLHFSVTNATETGPVSEEKKASWAELLCLVPRLLDVCCTKMMSTIRWKRLGR